MLCAYYISGLKGIIIMFYHLIPNHSAAAAAAAAAAAKSLQSCPTLCDPRDGSPPGSSVHGICQARVLSGLPLPSPTILEYYIMF